MDTINFMPISLVYIQENMSDFLDIITDGLHEYWKEQEFLFDMPKKWESSIAMTSNNKVIGIVISSLKNNLFHIHKFFIHRDYRNQGYGKILLQEFEHRIVTNFNINSISLKVYQDNTKAIEFYEANGFIKFDIDNNLFVLHKSL